MTGQNQQSGSAGTGSIPAMTITVLSDDSKYLFKRSEEASKHGTTPYDMFAAVLSGSPNEINSVAKQSGGNNADDYKNYNVKLYRGRCAGAVDAFYAELDRKAEIEAEQKGGAEQKGAESKEPAKGKP